MTATQSPLLEIRNLQKTFPITTGFFGRKSDLMALQDINFSVHPGETLGIVGESGCGKSTLGRAILNLIEANEGEVLWQGDNLLTADAEKMRKYRRDIQIIFQDPLASLNPRMTVGEIIADPLRTLIPEMSRKERQARVVQMMEAVGLLPEMINRYPHEFSGGQAQRIGIARALVTEPKMIVCDEPVSALDVSIQAQILNLLTDLKTKFNLTLIFISHDLSVVRHISDRIMVLYLGRMVELAKGDDLYDNPLHPYAQSLLQAIPIPDPKTARDHFVKGLTGEVPSPINPPSGCTFRTRCMYATDLCAGERPPLETVEQDRLVACHHWQDIQKKRASN